jgi:hypothetical protein
MCVYELYDVKLYLNMYVFFISDHNLFEISRMKKVTIHVYCERGE